MIHVPSAPGPRWRVPRANFKYDFWSESAHKSSTESLVQFQEFRLKFSEALQKSKEEVDVRLESSDHHRHRDVVGCVLACGTIRMAKSANSGLFLVSLMWSRAHANEMIKLAFRQVSVAAVCDFVVLCSLFLLWVSRAREIKSEFLQRENCIIKERVEGIVPCGRCSAASRDHGKVLI